jgi:hypothetical protein
MFAPLKNTILKYNPFRDTIRVNLLNLQQISCAPSENSFEAEAALWLASETRFLSIYTPLKQEQHDF